MAQVEDKGLSGMWPPVWMTTYSDMVTNVMVFFVILSAMLVLKIDVTLIAGPKMRGDKERPTKVKKLTAEQKTMVDNFRALEEQQMREAASVTKMQQIGEEIAQYILKANLQKFVVVETTKWKVKVVPLTPFLFSPGRAVIRPESRDFLDRLAKFFSINPGQIRIAGHTDNLPIYSAEYRSNWELSAARAAAIMRYLVEVHGLDPKRFVAVGCGPYQPLADNSTPEGRKENRRVEIEITQEPEPAGKAAKGGMDAAGTADGGGAVSPAN
jgi:chemotaxis protein MotB